MNPIDRALRKIGARATRIRKEVPCGDCHGAGNKSNDRGYSTPCVTCGGTGKINAEIRSS